MTSPYYQDEHVTLFHGDCEAVLSEFAVATTAGSTGQIVVTSPPYNMAMSPGGNGKGMYKTSKSAKGKRFHDGYDQYGDGMPQDEYDAWQRRILGLLWGVIPDTGAIYYNHKQRVEHGIARLPLGHDFGIPLRQLITWDRGTGIGVNRKHYASVSEFIYLFAKERFSLKDHSSSGRGDVWRLGMSREKTAHPAPFPVTLPAMALETSGAKSVLDPFAGTGTTLVAAKLAGAHGYGIEMSERYCEMAAERLQAVAAPFDFGASEPSATQDLDFDWGEAS